MKGRAERSGRERRGGHVEGRRGEASRKRDEDAEKITLDVCTTCHGVWLDAGELDAISKLDDKSFDKLSSEKRAEAFDQDLARQRGMRGRNVFAQALANFAHGTRTGARRFR